MAVFSLLATTGLRLSEVCRLEPDDVDLTEDVLTVRESKFRKSRLVPLHPTAAVALRSYAAQRDSRLGTCRSGGFFRTDRAEMPKPNTVERTFARLRERLGWTADGRARRRRIHDLRHSFAVHRLLAWHEQGVDLERKVLALSRCPCPEPSGPPILPVPCQRLQEDQDTRWRSVDPDSASA